MKAAVLSDNTVYGHHVTRDRQHHIWALRDAIYETCFPRLQLTVVPISMTSLSPFLGRSEAG